MSPDYDAFGRPIRSGPGGEGGAARPSGGSGDSRSSGGSRPSGGASGGSRPSGGGSWSPSSSGGGGGSSPGAGRGRKTAAQTGCGCVSLVVSLIVIGAIGLIALGAFVGDEDSATSGGSSTPFGAREDDPGSILSAQGTRGAFARLKTKLRAGERITSLSIREEYLSAQVTPGEGRKDRSITVRKDRDDDYESETSVSSGARGLSLEAIDLAGPQKLLAATRRGLGPRSRAKVAYVVLDVPTRPDERSGWAVYLEGTSSADNRWTSDIHGEHVLRPSDGAPAPPAGQQGPARTPAGVTGASLVRPANLRRAIAAVRAELPEDALVTAADVRPARVSVTARRSFRARTYTVDAAFGIEVGETQETATRDGLPISQVNAAGPERALRRIDARQGNGAPKRIDYVILNPRTSSFPGSRTVWSLYLRGGHPNGRYWRSTLDGRQIGRPGEASAP